MFPWLCFLSLSPVMTWALAFNFPVCESEQPLQTTGIPVRTHGHTPDDSPFPPWGAPSRGWQPGNGAALSCSSGESQLCSSASWTQTHHITFAWPGTPGEAVGMSPATDKRTAAQRPGPGLPGCQGLSFQGEGLSPRPGHGRGFDL